jgi:acyl carrier protein phosphodiesterase
VLDVSCDHWLSLQWPAWDAQTLDAFAERVYRVLTEQESALPGSSQRFAQRLRDHDMLTAYRDWNAVPATLQRIGTRLTDTANPLLTASAELAAAAAEFGSAFAGFYQDLHRELAAQGFPLNAGR